ncbi:MAG: hypothetical protein K2N87_19965 [Eubacterium sp.]|nr:hypothetical protein [Eubacterium sp.]
MFMHQLTCRNKHLLKRFLAVALSAAMMISGLPLTAHTAETTEPYVSLRTRFKTLQTGQSNWMTLKNNTIGWKITKVATSDRTIAMVYGRTEDGFMIKGKSAGRTTVRARLKTTSRKKYTSKLVSCRVNVVQPKEQGRTQAAVSSQEELLAALAEKSIRTITIQTPESKQFTIPKGIYTNVDLTVDAPLADIENYGVFQSVTIQSIKPDTWTEYAVGNTLRILAQASRIVVAKGARLKSLQYAKADAKATLEVNGAVDQVTVSMKTELQLSGSPENALEVSIEESASGTVLVSQVLVHVTLYASAELKFLKGAEQSTVTVQSGNYKITNETSAAIKVTKPDGKVETIASSQVPGSWNSGGWYPSITPPSITTGPSVIPTGPSVIPTGPAVSVPGEGSADADSEENKETFYFKSISKRNEYISKIIKAESAYTVTKLHVELQGDYTPVTASAILTFQLKEDPQALPEGVYVEWKCDGLSSNGSGDWEKLEGESALFTKEAQVVMGLIWPGQGDYIGPVITLRFQSDTIDVREQPVDVTLSAIETNLLHSMKEGDMYFSDWTYMETNPIPLNRCMTDPSASYPDVFYKAVIFSGGSFPPNYIKFGRK